LFLPHSVKNRLILWAVLALAVTSAASAVVCLTYSSRVAKAAANAGTIATNQGLNFEILLPLIIPYILLLVAIIVLFSWRVNRCINPLIDLTRRCREITINNLSLRFSCTENCKEANALVTEYNTMLDRLESGVKRIRQFSGDASHELRTPLTILRVVKLKLVCAGQKLRTRCATSSNRIWKR